MNKESMRKEYLFTTGQFASLNHINKRTLHYYDQIGLFSPEFKADNGYRYYTCFQTVQLELILTLRKIGLSVEEIKSYASSPSDDSFSRMIHEKKKLIDESIRQLLEAKNFLEQKSDKLALSLSAVHGKIELVDLSEERLLLSAPITGLYDDHDFSVAADFSLRLKSVFGLYDNFGSRISVSNLLSDQYGQYDCFFIRGREDIAKFDEIRPAGTYISTFCIGSWDRLKEIYKKIRQFAAENDLTLTGYAYEEGLNEMSIERQEDYIAHILVRCVR